MATKKASKSCTVPARNPTRQQYAKAKRDAHKTAKLLAPMFGKVTRDAMDGLPAMHDYPEYGEDCWHPAYDEMGAVQVLATAYTQYASALETIANGGYMPTFMLAMFAAAFTAAKANYLACWGAMEQCLNNIV